ncbi:MAG: hypothetical protein HXY20_05075 [Acidobacteria bacterium]|nr:hypothetical protein [Acidobacteriota bacterium]
MSLLQLSSGQVWTIPEVYRETVGAGLAKCYSDSAAIQEYFQNEVILLRQPRRRERLSGISLTDALVIMLAGELRTAWLLVNDHALLRRAEEQGVPARFTAEYVKQLYEKRAISRRRLESLFHAFLESRRYSEEFLNALLLQ